jgi:Ribosomal protein L6
MTENVMLQTLNEIRSDLAAVNDSWSILVVGSQIAAEIRTFRPPEPYNGKGVKYSDERIFPRKVKKK